MSFEEVSMNQVVSQSKDKSTITVKVLDYKKAPHGYEPIFVKRIGSEGSIGIPDFSQIPDKYISHVTITMEDYFLGRVPVMIY